MSIAKLVDSLFLNSSMKSCRALLAAGTVFLASFYGSGCDDKSRRIVGSPNASNFGRAGYDGAAAYDAGSVLDGGSPSSSRDGNGETAPVDGGVSPDYGVDAGTFRPDSGREGSVFSDVDAGNSYDGGVYFTEGGDGGIGSRQADGGCDPIIFYLDEDGDRFGDPSQSLESCTRPEGYVLDGTDCNPTDGSKFKMYEEVYVDGDLDLFPRENVPVDVCGGETLPEGYLEFGTSSEHPEITLSEIDCDDGDASVNPGREEIPYNGVDDDCKANTRDDDVDGDGRGRNEDCNDEHSSLWQLISGFRDQDGDTYTVGEVDKICSGFTLSPGYRSARSITDDCNDDDSSRWQRVLAYLDQDGDHFGSGSVQTLCLGSSLPPDYVVSGGDCKDDDDEIHPEAREICDNIDNDCDDQTADGSDDNAPLNTNQFGACENSRQGCIGGVWQDSFQSVSGYESVEVTCDNLDNDCDQHVDEDSVCGGWKQVGTGGQHTCGLRIDETVKCWGLNNYDQASPPSGNFVQISASSFHTCGLKPDNTVECWGHNGYGQSTPPSDTFLQISVGGGHTCGVTTNNTVKCWGFNNQGQANPPSGNFIYVSAGGSHNCGITIDDTIVCWGEYSSSHSGTFTSVDAGGAHTCGITTVDSTVRCWGHNERGQSTPPLGMFTQVSAGYYHTCGLKSDNTLECWGRNDYGQSTPPTGTFVQVSADGDYHVCAVTTDNTIICWGKNDDGQTDVPE